MGRSLDCLLRCQMVSCLLDHGLHPGRKAPVLCFPPPPSGKDRLPQLLHARDQVFAVPCRVELGNSVERQLFSHQALFGTCNVLRPVEDPPLKLQGRPQFLVGAHTMCADPEQHPEEGFQFMHETVSITTQSTDGHEYSGAGPSWSSRCLQVVSM